MIIKEAAPTLTCEASGNGFQFELLLTAEADQPPITKVRVGPYVFKKECQPGKPILIFVTGGPENCFLMHKTTPRGWSRWTWEVDDTDPEHPSYLVSSGTLPPGKQGIFQFTSLYAPGGLRAGLEIYRGENHSDYGVTGPNYEPFLAGDHVH